VSSLGPAPAGASVRWATRERSTAGRRRGRLLGWSPASPPRSRSPFACAREWARATGAVAGGVVGWCVESVAWLEASGSSLVMHGRSGWVLTTRVDVMGAGASVLRSWATGDAGGLLGRE
jgi:hypothetical protein